MTFVNVHTQHFLKVNDSANMTSLIDLNGDTSPWSLPFTADANKVIDVNQAASAGGSSTGDDRIDLAVTLPDSAAWVRLEYETRADAANRWQITDLRLDEADSHRFWELPFQRSTIFTTTWKTLLQPRTSITKSGQPILGLGEIAENPLTLGTTLNGSGVTSVVMDSAIPDSTPSVGSIRVQLDDGRTRLVAYTSWTGSTFTTASTNWTDPDDATAGNSVWVAPKLVLRVRFESEQISTTASGGDAFQLRNIAVRCGVMPTTPAPVVYNSGPQAFPIIECDPYSESTGEPLSAHVFWRYVDGAGETKVISEGQVAPDQFGRLKWAPDRMLPPGVTNGVLTWTTFFGMFGTDVVEHVEEYTGMSTGTPAAISTSESMSVTVSGDQVTVDTPAALSAVSWQVERSADGGTTWDPVYTNRFVDWNETTGAQVSLRATQVSDIVDYPPLNTPIQYRAYAVDEQGDGETPAALPPTALEGAGGWTDAHPTQVEDNF